MFLLLYAMNSSWIYGIITIPSAKWLYWFIIVPTQLLLLIKLRLLPWIFIPSMKRSKVSEISSIQAPYIPVRYRNQNGYVSCMMRRAWIHVVSITGLLGNTLATWVRPVIGWQSYHYQIKYRPKSKGGSQRKFSLRAVRYKYRSMYLCSLLTHTSNLSPSTWKLRHGKQIAEAEMSALDTSLSRRKGDMVFDTDSFAIKIDNCCTRSMSHCKRDFVVGTLRPVRSLVVKGYGGSTTNITHQGTIS
jgi:hypothetical protein